MRRLPASTEATPEVAKIRITAVDVGITHRTRSRRSDAVAPPRHVEVDLRELSGILAPAAAG